MNFLSTAALSLAMSTDAFAAAVGKGAALEKPSWGEALKTGVIFGVIEAITPLVGWALGRAAAPYVAAWDHWIAFLLLGGIGLIMMRSALLPEHEMPLKPARHTLGALALAGFATSIDAMVVGVGVALLNADIVITAMAIGVSTFLMVTIGVMAGRALGALVGRRAELMGGFLLISIGCVILYEHTLAKA